MNDHFNCESCDKTIKIKSMKRYLKSQYHETLSKSFVYRYINPYPDFSQIENILKKFILECNKKFECYVIICKRKL